MPDSGDHDGRNAQLIETGNLTALTSLAQDADGDGASNQAEYQALTRPTVADSDGDTLSDGQELNSLGTDPLKSDTDGDDMPDGWEVSFGLQPIVADGFEDADGDRYPNAWEYAGSTNPSSAASTPTANLPVGTGQTYATVSAAVSAANIANGAYQIVGIAPGTYTGAGNTNITIGGANKPKFLIIGTGGAAVTKIDGLGSNLGWSFMVTTVVESLTFTRTTRALYAATSGVELRLIDLVVRQNSGSAFPGGLYVNGNSVVAHSTFLDNTTTSGSAHQVAILGGTHKFTNTVIYGTASGLSLYKAPTGTTLNSNYCLASGITLTGVGNLPGTTIAKLRADGRLLHDSPLRSAGGSLAQSKRDLDLEVRPASAPDIGADQFVDSDSDSLADAWEQVSAGNLTALSGLTQDYDADGLNNQGEYAKSANPTVTDTDADGLSDGAEVNVRFTDPANPDTDGDLMTDGWEVSYSLNPLLDDAWEDRDGDRYPNVFEFVKSTNPASTGSLPAPDEVVDPANAGASPTDNIHATLVLAQTAASGLSTSHPIISIAPGTYSGASANASLGLSGKVLLVVSQGGPAATVLDAEARLPSLSLGGSVIVNGLTIRRAQPAVAISGNGRIRLENLLIVSNRNTGTPGLTMAGGSLVVLGSTFLNNVASPSGTAHAIEISGGTAYFVNTVAWGQAPGTTVYIGGAASVSGTHSLLQGYSLAGTGNLSGATDPRLRGDGRLLSNSPLRSAGDSGYAGGLDLDLEVRPSPPDIGIDQYIDSDSDVLPDAWERGLTGNLTTLGTGDFDGDGLSDYGEYQWCDADRQADPRAADSDGDRVRDGDEIIFGTNPLLVDADLVTADANHDGVMDNLGYSIGLQPSTSDDDGDGLSNATELALGTDPLRADSDGDGVPDSVDALPTDPARTSLGTPPNDVTPPVVTLTVPANAVLQ